MVGSGTIVSERKVKIFSGRGRGRVRKGRGKPRPSHGFTSRTYLYDKLRNDLRWTDHKEEDSHTRIRWSWFVE